MAGYQLDSALDDLDVAMKQLKRSMQNLPVARQGFKSKHDRAAKDVATLSVSVSDSRAMIRDK